MVNKKRQKPTVSKKKSKATPSVNPFELKFNRLKHNVLGKKKSGSGVGHPGLSRKRAYEQRQKTLGVEYDRIGKVNKVIDKRLGEKNQSITKEEKASLRFTAERTKHLKKGSKFNLTDDGDETEVLTHEGRALTDVQKYDRTMGSDEDDDDAGTIGADVVKAAHFGGGDLEESINSDGKISRKDLMAELIAKTRQAREEKHIAKDEMETVTEELDAKYLKLLDKVKTGFRPVGAAKAEKPRKDDYDTLAISLKIDADSRATPAERTKTAEELAMEERLHLEKMESLRLLRMNAEANRGVHSSVDDERISRKFRGKGEKCGFEVRFGADGRLLDADKVESVSIKKVAVDSDAEMTDEEQEDENEEELDDLLEQHDNDQTKIVKNVSNQEQEKIDEDRVGHFGDDTNDVDEDDEDEENADIDEDEEDEEDEEDLEGEDGDALDDDSAVQENCRHDLSAATTMAKLTEQSADTVEDEIDIPFVFEMPKSYEAFVELLGKYPVSRTEIVLQRLIKCYHPSLAEGNKKLLSKMFLYMLRFYDDTSNTPPTSNSVKILGALTVTAYALLKFDVEFSVRCVRALLRQKWKERMRKPKAPTPFSLITLLRLITSLFPVSDRWHPVCSPAMALAAVTLAKSRITDLTTLARQILLVTVVSDYVEESRRFVPEAIAFCQGALLMAVETEDSERAPTNVFPISLPHRRMLLVTKDLTKDAAVEPLNLSVVFSNKEGSLGDDDLDRCRVLRALVAVIQKYSILYGAHEHTFTATFCPFVKLLKQLPTNRLPSIVVEEVEALCCSMEAECKLRSRLTQMSRVVTEQSMLNMLEPRFEENFDPERPRLNRDQRRQGSRAEKEKLRYMVKKETRGAIKELRKDARFLMRKQRKEIAAKDRDRREKTKRLLSGLQTQQGEWNKELRESGKKKPK